ncbi:MAG: DUF4870 family protein [Gammaproteobacteria bacterium]
MNTAEKGHGVTIVAYVLHLLGAITGILSIVALIINYVKRGDDGVNMDSHHSWMIRSFWWAILWCVLIGASYFLLVGFIFGWIAFAIVWIWYIYRHVRGLLYLSEDKPMPA